MQSGNAPEVDEVYFLQDEEEKYALRPRSVFVSRAPVSPFSARGPRLSQAGEGAVCRERFLAQGLGPGLSHEWEGGAWCTYTRDRSGSNADPRYNRRTINRLASAE